MSKRIYYEGDEGDPCEVGEDLLPGVEECGEGATYSVRDTETGIVWSLCAEHKEAVRAAGVAS